MSSAEPRVRDFPRTPPGQLRPAALLDELREREPVSRVRLPFGRDGWLVTRHDDVRTVLTDHRFSRAAGVSEDVPRSTPRVPRADSILSMDPPEHSRLRGLLVKAFTARRVEQLKPRTEAIARGLLDTIADGGGPADLVEQFCLPLPVTVICELLGVPAARRGSFREWSEAFVSSTRLTGQEIEAAHGHLRDCLAELIAERRAVPGDDLLGALVTARDAEGRLSEGELVTFGVTLLVAGHETTAGQLGNFLYLLLTHPDELRLLRARPDLLPSAIEEMLRYVPIAASAGFARIAKEDVVLSGVTIRAGEAVLASEPAGNRDASVFADADALRFDRKTNPHLAFGHGVHHCLGAPLARMELHVAIKAVLDRFPGLRLAVDPREVRWKSGSLAHGVAELPVIWE
ncbi:cytochrome P450 [Streptomyces sp. NPDC057963]|uniref:cytochrome P450 n=1 Tax=Streptomyces sp. NPDC057963 TaxID=3346290 RepID=UPI0036F0481F